MKPRILLSLIVALACAAAIQAAPSDHPVTLTGAGIALQGPGAKKLIVPFKTPAFLFDNCAVPAEPIRGPHIAEKAIRSGRLIEIQSSGHQLSGGGALEIVLCLQWTPKESVLRKWARYRVTERARTLQEVVLEDLEIAGAVPTPPSGVQSQPVFLPGIFCGIEFPIASARLESGRLRLAHQPGRQLEPGIWYETRKAVYGVAEAGNEKRAFRQYIQRHWISPRGIHVDYNSWWTSPCPYTEKDILDLMSIFKKRFYDPYAGRFDTFCIDMGWSNSKSLWEIDTRLFPDGFDRIRAAAREMGSRPGLWISPSSRYPQALDGPWAQAQGYETVDNGLCLGGPRYRKAFRNRLEQYAARDGFRQFKFDGYLAECRESNHGHLPNALSAETIAEGIIDAAEGIHQLDPNIWIEPTCFGWNPSPWWLFHFNSVIGSYGDDAPYGRVPCPIYRESYTTARDFFNLQGAYWNPIPPAAQEVLGIIHQTPEPFLNDAVMTVMRGHRFLPVYLNPRYMDEARWESLAHVLRWARKNVPAFEETFPLLPASWQGGACPQFSDAAPMPREPYGYAHRTKKGPLIALRNPWIQPQSYRLTLDERAGVEQGTGPYAAISLYPEPRCYAENLSAGQTIDIPLAPYETLVLSFKQNKTKTISPISPISPIQATAPTKKENPLTLHDTQSQFEKLQYDNQGAALGPDWTRLTDSENETHFRASAAATVAAPTATLALLLDGTAQARTVRCTIDGNDTELLHPARPPAGPPPASRNPKNGFSTPLLLQPARTASNSKRPTPAATQKLPHGSAHRGPENPSRTETNSRNPNPYHSTRFH